MPSMNSVVICRTEVESVSLMKVAPVIGNFLLDLQPDTCLKLIFESLSVVLERAKLSHISKCPGNADAYPDAYEDPVDFFPSLPKLHGDVKYTRDSGLF